MSKFNNLSMEEHITLIKKHGQFHVWFLSLQFLKNNNLDNTPLYKSMFANCPMIGNSYSSYEDFVNLHDCHKHDLAYSFITSPVFATYVENFGPIVTSEFIIWMVENDFSKENQDLFNSIAKVPNDHQVYSEIESLLNKLKLN